MATIAPRAGGRSGAIKSLDAILATAEKKVAQALARRRSS